MKEHRHERIVKMLAQRFEHDLELLTEWARTDGRPLFQVKLTEREELARWLIPQLRDQIITEKIKTDGVDAANKHIARMNKLYQREVAVNE